MLFNKNHLVSEFQVSKNLSIEISVKYSVLKHIVLRVLQIYKMHFHRESQLNFFIVLPW